MRKDAILQVVAMLWFLALTLLTPTHSPPRPALQQDPAVSAPLHLRLAEAVLAKAERLNAVQVGSAGITPSEALAWRIIVGDPSGREIFEALLDVPSRPTRLYALIGLRWLGSRSYAAAAAALRAQGGTIDVTIGCIASTQPIGRILDDIDSGHWGAEFMRGQLLQPN
jgi:hypothetical protein